MATSVAVERNPSMIAAAESTKKTSGGSGKDQGGHDGRNNKKKKKRPSVTISLTNCKYDCVRRVAKRFGMRIVNDEDDWTIYWTDMALPERVGDIKSFQKVNHFPGMNEICRKDLLARNMNRMLKLFPREYNCFPQTWTLPADYGDFQSYIQSKKNKVFIAKPGSGCQGKGIFLFKNLKDVKPGEHVVCQQYISKPFTIDKFKFDLRLYVLVTSCDPLRVYCYKDGLVRLATVKYKEPTGGNMDELCMHLTNYAINKHSKDFMRDEECGSKRRITTLNSWFTSNGYDIDKIWSDIDDVIIKTLISAHPVVSHNYRSFFPNHSRGSACFEILGFDILLDRKLKPWLMEVNRSPSFHTDSPLDKEIKEGLIYDTFNLIDLFANDRRRCIEEERQRARDRLLYRQRSKETSVNDKDVKAEYMTHFEKYEETHLGEYRRIYPLNGNEERYVKFFNQNTSLCVQTIASKARADLAKQMREELELKQKEMEKYLKKEPRMKEGVRGGGDGTESPPRDKKPPAIRRRSYTIRLHNETTKDTCKDVPCEVCGDIQSIQEEEEMERLASLQLRDSLVRGLGVPERVKTILESQPASRVQTPLPQLRQDDHTHPFSANATPTKTVARFSASHSVLEAAPNHPIFTTPEHKYLEGVPSVQLPGYRNHNNRRNLFRTNPLGWIQVISRSDTVDSSVASESPHLQVGGVEPGHHGNHRGPSLELYGSAISLCKGDNRRLSGRTNRTNNNNNNNKYYNYYTTNVYPSTQYGLTIRGMSVTERVKHLKYLSNPSHNPP